MYCKSINDYSATICIENDLLYTLIDTFLSKLRAFQQNKEEEGSPVMDKRKL